MRPIKITVDCALRSFFPKREIIPVVPDWEPACMEEMKEVNAALRQTSERLEQVADAVNGFRGIFTALSKQHEIPIEAVLIPCARFPTTIELPHLLMCSKHSKKT